MTGARLAKYAQNDAHLTLSFGAASPPATAVRQDPVCREADPDPLPHPGRGRLGGADRRRHRREPAARRAVLVPVQRPGRQQGAPSPSSSPCPRHTTWPSAATSSASTRAAATGSGSFAQPSPMAPYLATVQIGQYVRRRLRGWRRAADRRVAPADLPAAGFDGVLRAAAGDDGVLRGGVRALPVPVVHHRRHRRPARDPAGVPGAVDVRPQLLPPRLGRRAARRARAGAPVVRQRGHGGQVARHLAARGLRLLRRVALVRAVRRAERGGGAGRRAPRRLAGLPQDLLLTDPTPG